MTDLVELVDANRFLGRELLLWLWFESEVNETQLAPTGADGCALWMEAQLTLAAEGEESRLKGPTPSTSPEAKEALRQGKLPREARLRMVHGEHEFSWLMKADELAKGGLKVPAQLEAEGDKYEALYERMRLVEELEAQLDALFADFLALRLSPAWDQVVVPLMRRWARGAALDLRAYASLRARGRGRAKARAAAAALERA